MWYFKSWLFELWSVNISAPCSLGKEHLHKLEPTSAGCCFPGLWRHFYCWKHPESCLRALRTNNNHTGVSDPPVTGNVKRIREATKLATKMSIICNLMEPVLKEQDKGDWGERTCLLVLYFTPNLLLCSKCRAEPGRHVRNWGYDTRWPWPRGYDIYKYLQSLAPREQNINNLLIYN